MRQNENLWVEKYRPQTLDDCILPKELYSQFKSIIDADELPHLMFTGTAGIGKTTVATMLAKVMERDYIIINASNDRNIDMLRNEIATFASSVSTNGKDKIVILDEADYLNPQSTQPALRGFLQDFANNCRFIFTCNYPNKVIKELHSRCSIKKFVIDIDEYGELTKKFLLRLFYILDTENIIYKKKDVAELVLLYAPDFRRVLNELQNSCLTGSYVKTVSKDFDNIKKLISFMKEDKFTSMKTWVHDNIDNDPTFFFDVFYDNLYETLQKPSIPEAVVILADYQYKSAFVVNQEINMVACLTEIMTECNFL